MWWGWGWSLEWVRGREGPGGGESGREG
jgi:hypothetical protein